MALSLLLFIMCGDMTIWLHIVNCSVNVLYCFLINCYLWKWLLNCGHEQRFLVQYLLWSMYGHVGAFTVSDVYRVFLFTCAISLWSLIRYDQSLFTAVPPWDWHSPSYGPGIIIIYQKLSRSKVSKTRARFYDYEIDFLNLCNAFAVFFFFVLVCFLNTFHPKVVPNRNRNR